MSAPEAQAAGQTVELLFFRIGDETYGADASQVVRVSQGSATAHSEPSLGALRRGGRALMVVGREGLVGLRVDEVLGVRSVQIEALRRTPRSAGAKKFAVGLYLAEGKPLWLLDLAQVLDG